LNIINKKIWKHIWKGADKWTNVSIAVNQYQTVIIVVKVVLMTLKIMMKRTD
jgi:hypothetical protein